MTSHPEWGPRTTATDAAAAFSDRIKGQYILITGLSPTSLGAATAHALAAHRPALLLLASRNPTNLSAVRTSLTTAHPSTPTLPIPLDLLSPASVRAAATTIAAAVPRLDLVVHTAAVMTRTRRSSDELGVEAQFATNHLGPFLLTNLLAPKLAPGARVVNVSSLGLRISPVRFSDYNIEREDEDVPPEERGVRLRGAFARAVDGYRGFVAYGQSKTANVLFAVGLRGRGVRAVAVHPGSIWTNLSRDLDEEGVRAIEGTATDWKSADEGAATIVVAGLDPELDDDAKGVFLSDCQFYEVPAYATDPGNAERLWALSEELVKERFEYTPKL